MVNRHSIEERRALSALLNPDSPEQKSFSLYVLSELRLARKRALLLVNEIEVIGVALKGGIVDPDTALEMLADANCLDFLLPTEPEKCQRS
jgi:hypothetical protein